MDAIWNELLLKLGKWRVEARSDMSFDQLTTFGTGGKIRLTVFPDTKRKLVKTARLLRKLSVRSVVVGRGSNVLASDDFFDGVVVVTTKLNGFRLRGSTVLAQCGASSAAIAAACAKRGLADGEFLACLPATVGGSTVGNAGCFGQDMARIVKRVTVLANGRVRRVKREQCRFAKRESVFKHVDWVILEVKLHFTRSTPELVGEKIANMRRRKAQTQPLGARSAGCVLFHDSVAVSALVDEMGLKGFRMGGAAVSTKHAGFVLNIDKSTSLDIYLLIRYLKSELLTRYGICAKTELALINFTEK